MTTALLYHHLKTVLEFKIVDDQMTVTLLRRELCPAREDAPFLEALVRSDSHVLIDQKQSASGTPDHSVIVPSHNWHSNIRRA
jgi:hypothetical protein